jgi:hypothetical protein
MQNDYMRHRIGLKQDYSLKCLMQGIPLHEVELSGFVLSGSYLSCVKICWLAFFFNPWGVLIQEYGADQKDKAADQTI